MKRKTSKHRRHPRQSVLEVRVMSPRIAWFGFLKFAGKVAKLACVLAVLTGIGWGVWRGIQHAFYKNPDFRLQVIDLNTNPVLDELGVTKVAGIDLTANPSLFDVDVNETAQKLSAVSPEPRTRGFPARTPDSPRSAAPAPCWWTPKESPTPAQSAKPNLPPVCPSSNCPPPTNTPSRQARRSDTRHSPIASDFSTPPATLIRKPCTGSS